MCLSKDNKNDIITWMKKRLPVLAIASYLSIMFVATESFWTAIINKHCGGFISAVTSALEIDLVNVFTFFVIMVFALYCGYNTFHKKRYNIILYPILLSAAWLMIFGSTWTPIETFISGVYFNQLICGLLCTIVLLMLIVTYMNWKNNKKRIVPNIDAIGFSVDTQSNKLIDVGWKFACESLYEKLVNTNIENDCFAIGITGVWGSGKSTFLENLKEQLDKSFTVINYNPWNCQDTTQIVSNFFLCLNESLGEDERELTKSILDYSESLQAEDISWASKLASLILPKEDKSIQTLKTMVNNHVKTSKRSIAIIIDDIDRLDKDETLEVLRLIRITANFANMVFVVAYDSRHVVQMLAENGIDNGYEFLHKIFQLEYSLPTYEDYKIPQILYTELISVITDRNKQQLLKDVVTSRNNATNKYVFLNYLTNFRDVKRFVNAFALSYYQMEKSELIVDYDLIDLFWLELLHYSDVETYTNLYLNRFDYLESMKGLDGLARYSIKKKRKEDNEEPLKGIINEDSLFILKNLFEYNARNKSQICYETNFANYFCCRLPEHCISLQQLLDLINKKQTDEQLADQLTQLISIGYIKKRSLANQVAKLTVSSLPTESLRRLIFILVWIGEHFKFEEVRSIICTQLLEEHYPLKERPALKVYLMEQLRLSFHNTSNLLNWPYILCQLYPICYHDPENGLDHYDSLALIGPTEIIQLANENLKIFIKKIGGWPPITELTHVTNLQKFLKASTTITDMEEGYYENSFSMCLAIDGLTKHYSETKSTEFKKFCELMYPDSEYDYDESIEHFKKMIIEIFGNQKDYIKFITECFDIDEDTKMQHLIELGFEKRPNGKSQLITNPNTLPPEVYYS